MGHGEWHNFNSKKDLPTGTPVWMSVSAADACASFLPEPLLGGLLKARGKKHLRSFRRGSAASGLCLPVWKSGGEPVLEVLGQRRERASPRVQQSVAFEEQAEVFGSEGVTRDQLDRSGQSVSRFGNRFGP
jgi:hypothetical protein